MIRRPTTLFREVYKYLCYGTGLLEDLKGMSTLPKKARYTRLEQTGHNYALGWIEYRAKNCVYLGIDRAENISRRFKFPKEATKKRVTHAPRKIYESLPSGAGEGEHRVETVGDRQADEHAACAPAAQKPYRAGCGGA